MDLYLPRLSALSAIDVISVTFMAAAFFVIGWLVEHPPASRPSMSNLMAEYRRAWMREFVVRQQKIFDGTVITSLRQATSFFISGTMIAMGGGVALIGNSEKLVLVAEDLTLAADAAVIELKVIVVLLFVANAFLKFVWSHRLFGYCAVLMGSVPSDASALAYHRSAQAAEINVTAARSYNRGLRSVYFALAALGWLLGPWSLLATTVLTSSALLRREFASESRQVVMRPDPEA